LRRGFILIDTYDRRVQLDAARHRYKDARSLQKSERWNGAIYLGGYAIECSLKALICYEGCTNNLRETLLYKGGKREGVDVPGIQGAGLHNLWALYNSSAVLQRAIGNDRTGKLKSAWHIITQLWQKDSLRYGRELGHKAECDRFLQAVEHLYFVILRKQGENLE
jgi:hypothetical protein